MVNSFQAEYQQQREVLKSVATTLKAATVPFALTGGYAIWARGGPESERDVDFSPLLSYPRALREQIDWECAAKETTDHPFAHAFLGLLESLEVVPHGSHDVR